MINKDRIVPVTKTDLITLYSVILAQDSNNSSMEKLAAADVEGNFAVATNSKTYLAAEPVKEVVFGASITACTLYFMPGVDFAGFKKTGATLTISGEVGDPGLYSATLSTNALTIAKVGL